MAYVCLQAESPCGDSRVVRKLGHTRTRLRLKIALAKIGDNDVTYKKVDLTLIFSARSTFIESIGTECIILVHVRVCKGTFFEIYL